jgi:hypothetical protein
VHGTGDLHALRATKTDYTLKLKPPLSHVNLGGERFNQTSESWRRQLPREMDVFETSIYRWNGWEKERTTPMYVA